MPNPPERRPAEVDLRASDAEREQVIDLLRRHAGEGRITADELSERIDAVYSARTVGDLRAPLADLPPDAPRPSADRRARRRPSFAARLPLVGVAAVVLAAALTGAWWLLWTLWPLLALTRGGGWGCRRRAVATADTTPTIERKVT